MKIPTGRLLPRLRGVVGAHLPESIVLYRAGSALTAQAARVWVPRGGNYREGTGATQEMDVIKIAMAHTATLRAGDTFTYDGYEWEVVEVPVLASYGAERSAIAERRG